MTPLCNAALAGDAEAFGLAYDRYAPVVYGLLLRILREGSDAQDILQETFLVAWSNARSFDVKRGSELAWVISMARSRAIDRLRGRQRRQTRELQAGREILIGGSHVDPVADDRMLFQELRSAVRGALDELPAPQRTALELAYFDGLSQSEIAARLGEPLGTIKTRTNLAMKRLRERLSELKR